MLRRRNASKTLSNSNLLVTSYNVGEYTIEIRNYIILGAFSDSDINYQVVLELR
jgi:hypothetical protein